MRIPTWRIALTGVAIVILLGLGIGLVAASTGGSGVGSTTNLAAATAAPAASGAPDRPGKLGLKHWLAGRAARLGVGRHLVHVIATFTDKDGNLVTIQIDHGTVQSIGGGSLVISEAGSSTVTVSTDDATKVWIGRDAGKLTDLKVGDTVFVQSRVDGSTLAKRILKVPADTGS